MTARTDLARAHQLLAIMRPPRDGTDSVEALRSRYEALCAQFPPPPEAAIQWLDGPMKGSVRVRAGERTGNDRVILFFHGGGGVFGSPKGYRGWAARLADATGADVVVPRYRLAPEHPFPAGVDDAVDAWSWLRSTGVDPAHIALYGDSAGGGMALAVAIRLRDEAAERPAAVVAVSPVTDRVGYGRSFETKAAVDVVVSRAGTARTRALYLGAAAPESPLASPLLADLEGLPPLLLQVGSDECLLDDSTRFAAKAGEQGVAVRLSVAEQMFHAYPLVDFLPESHQALDEVARFLNECW